MKRVYRCSSVSRVGHGWRVLLDDKPVHTPGCRPLELPCQGLAQAIADEWGAQTATLDPNTMPLMRLAATALDWVAPNRDHVVDIVAGYAETDLVCYRAEHPAELVARQQALWQPLVDWATSRYDAPFVVISGVMPRAQPPAVVAAIRSAAVAIGTSPLLALHNVTTSCGSVVIGLALMAERIDAEAAWAASQLDESFQIERWGEDVEAERRRSGLRADIEAVARFLRLLGVDD